MTKLLIIFLIGTSLLGSCWEKKELSKMAEFELDEKIILSFKSAIDCSPISGVKVQIGNQNFMTNRNGYIKIDAPLGIMDDSLPMTTIKKGFINLKKNLRVQVETLRQNTFLLSPKLPLESLRVVLSWGDKPKDLDLHLVTDEYHISYRNKRNYRNLAKLDRDGISGFGPETITVDKVDARANYKVIVDNYSKSPSINSKATVEIYFNGELQNSIVLPNTSSKKIKVCEIKNGELKI